MQKNFEYAQANGYKGTFDEYVEAQYQGYCDTCKRCDCIPMNKSEWLATKRP